MRTRGVALGTLILLASAPGGALAEGDDHMKLSRGLPITLVEAGVRHALQDETVLAAGAGVGLGLDSADFRLLPGVQRSF